MIFVGNGHGKPTMYLLTDILRDLKITHYGRKCNDDHSPEAPTALIVQIDIFVMFRYLRNVAIVQLHGKND